MRTLNKALCLVLSVVMLLGLCVFSVSAEETFSDATEAQYTEAIEVLAQLDVLRGYPDGSLKPTEILTRAEAAAYIARLMNMGSLSGKSSFTDTPDWVQGEVAYCEAQGIIAGYGDGTFGPDDKLTGSQFEKMLLVALGYDPTIENLVGSQWEIYTAKIARKIDLDDGIDSFDATAEITREQAAQLALNALKADVVDYDNRGTDLTLADGTTIRVGASSAEPLENKTAKYNGAIVAGDNILQLGEQIYKGDLKRQTANTKDDSRRPATEWTWKTNTTIGTYPNEPDHVVVISKAKTVEEAIDDISRNYDDTTYKGDGATAGNIVNVNGANSWTTNTTNLLVGDVVEIYLDDTASNQVDQVIVTRYSAGKVTGATATKTSGQRTEVRVPGVVDAYTDAEDVHGYEGLVKDDIVYYYKTVDTGAYYIYLADTFEGELTATKGSNPAKYVIGGTEYVVNGNVAASVDNANDNKVGVKGLTTPDYNTLYQFWTDGNGYVIAGKQLESVSRDYVMIKELKYIEGNSLADSNSVEARLVFADGTTKVVKLASVKDSSATVLTYKGVSTTETGSSAKANPANEHWLAYKYANNKQDVDVTAAVKNTANGAIYTYTVNKDGEYELTNATQRNNVTVVAKTYTNNGSGAEKIKASTGTFGKGAGDTVAVNDSTVFIVKDKLTNTSDNKYKVYTGKNSMPDISVAAKGTLDWVAATEKGVATYVFVAGASGTGTNTSTTNDTIVLLNAKANSTQKSTGNNSYVYGIYDALVDGAYKTVKIAEGTNTIKVGELEPAYKDGDVVNKLDDATDDGGDPTTQTRALGYDLSGGILRTGKTFGTDDAYTVATYSCPSGATVVIKNGDEDYTVGTVGDVLNNADSDENDEVYVIRTKKGEDDNQVSILYIIRKAADEKGITPSYAQALTKTENKTATIEGEANTKYTEYKNENAGSGTLKFTLDAGSKYVYNTTGWTADNFDTSKGATEVTENDDFSQSVMANTSYYVKVTATDNSVAYYLFTIKTS